MNHSVGAMRVANQNTGLQVRSVFFFMRHSSGAAAAEYALILSIIATAVATAALTMGTSIDNALTTVGATLSAVVFSVS